MSDHIAFTHGFVRRRDELYVAAISLPLEAKNVHHGYMLRKRGGQWGHWSTDIRIAGICAVEVDGEAVVVVMGHDGWIEVLDSAGFHREHVDPGATGPSQLRHLKCIREIGGYLYVAGMARQVYRRSVRGGAWQRADVGLLVPRSSTELAGLLALDGFGPNEIYAVGFYGQIWRFDGRVWHAVESPTNLKLECVRCIRPGIVRIAGAGGIVLEGRGDSWLVIEQDHTEATFWGMEHAFGSTWLATDQGEIYRLADDELKPVNLGLGGTITTRGLHANDGLLLSIGEADLVAYNGVSWVPVTHPPTAA